MEFHNQFNKAEAERWLSTAVKLLTTRDLHGTKSFAIRARESDPRLGATEQLIAVVDTLLAGESQINNQPDWYGILQLAHRTHSLELVASRYRRLALLLHPQANRFPYADHAFRLVSDAWTVLSNPSKKAFYDRHFPSPPSAARPAPFPQVHAQQHQVPPQPLPPPPPVRKSPRKNVTEIEIESEPSKPPQPVRKSPRKNVTEIEIEPEPSEPEPLSTTQVQGESSFWTACPYCYHLFEYSRAYAECMLRCQNCKRAFHAVVISTPPVMDNGEANFCCWAYFPMGLSRTVKDTTPSSNWTPFSSMFACPLQPSRKKAALGPRVYYKDDDDDDASIDISDPSEESDDEWHSDKRRKKRAGRPKRKASASKTPARASDRIRKAATQSLGGQGMESNGGTSSAVSLSNKKTSAGASATARKRGAAALGKLDLNVEFSNNEVEEPAAQTMSDGNGTGNGEEETIEGIGFFEGLDEFLSSLPILNVVGDDKVKAN